MKCHRILGIEETATEQQIEHAYLEKIEKLRDGSSPSADVVKAEKEGELRIARGKSLTWLSLTNQEKRSARLKEAKDSLSNPNIMHSSPIGCCSACCGGCVNSDSCCKNCCGSEVEWCSEKVDIGIYIILGIAAVVGVISLIPKAVAAIRKSNERNQQQRRSAAIAENQRLQSELTNVNDQLRNAGEVLDAAAKQYDRTVAFCHFFEVVGCNSCASIVILQQGAVNESRAQVVKINESANQIRAQIQRNDQVIKR